MCPQLIRSFFFKTVCTMKIHVLTYLLAECDGVCVVLLCSRWRSLTATAVSTASIIQSEARTPSQAPPPSRGLTMTSLPLPSRRPETTPWLSSAPPADTSRRLFASSFIRHNKVCNIKLMKHTVGKTYQAHRALTVAFN